MSVCVCVILDEICLDQNCLSNRDEDEQVVDGDAAAAEEPAKEVKRSAWARPQRRKAGGGSGGGGAGAKNKHKAGTVKPRGQTVKTTAAQAASAAAAAASATPNSDGKSVEKSQPIKDSESEADSGQEEADEKEDPSTDDEKKVSSVEDDDVEWEKFQQKLNKREKLEGKSKVSHSVHCPCFPEDKQEYWWTYICDRKSKTLLTAPYNVTNLVDVEEIQLKFTAPRWPGIYTFTVCLRSGSISFSILISLFQCVLLCFLDSYMGMDQQQELKLDVKEAPVIPTDHPQWDISESESEKDDQQGNESEFTTDTSDEDE